MLLRTAAEFDEEMWSVCWREVTSPGYLMTSF